MKCNTLELVLHVEDLFIHMVAREYLTSCIDFLTLLLHSIFVVSIECKQGEKGGCALLVNEGFLC